MALIMLVIHGINIKLTGIMKKIYSALAVIASILLFASCSKEADAPEISDERVAMKFGVTLSEDPLTRTVVSSFDENGPVGVKWVEGDKVTVFAENHSKGDNFKLDEIKSPATYGIFSGETYRTTGAYYGVYPAQDNARLSYDKDGEPLLSFIVPSSQTALRGSFDPNAAVMIGVAETWDSANGLDLKNVCACFRITLDKGCESVVVQAQPDAGGESVWLAGTVTAKVAEGTRQVVKYGSNCSKEIVLSGSGMSEGGSFLIPFLPSSKCPKIIVTANYYPGVEGKANQVQKSYVPNKTESPNGTFSFSAGNVYELGAFGYTEPKTTDPESQP